MPESDLKYSLEKQLITIKNRVLVSDLVDSYDISYEAAHKIFEEHILALEGKGAKYLKRYLIHGEEKHTDRVIYTVVQGEAKLEEWLSKLTNAESFLYSVEIAGSGKCQAQHFEPLKRFGLKIKNNQTRENKHFKITSGHNDDKKPDTKVQIETITCNTQNRPTEKISDAGSTKTKVDDKKPSPEVKKTSPEKKKSIQKTAGQKGINSFFLSNLNTGTDKTDKPTNVTKSPKPKGMQDYFKKPVENVSAEISNENIKQEAINTSVQLFEADEIESSDEEEKLEALKRDVFASDHEDFEEDGSESSSKSNKRRRIEDSDEEDKQQTKIEKVENENMQVEEDATPQSETYLDDEGFVITIKHKKSTNISRAKKNSPPKVCGSPAKAKSPSKSSGVSSNAATKTKQGNIMSFFKKK